MRPDVPIDVTDELRQTIERASALPGSAYSDPSLFELEFSSLFRQGWLGLTCGQLVPNPGDVYPVSFGKLELLVVRQKTSGNVELDNEGIRVFYNLCRHRGARLIDQPCKAKAGLMVCPYHGWSYRTDGCLAAAPEFNRDGKNSQPSEDQKENLGLIELPVRLWRDIIFIHLAEEPEDFNHWIRPINDYLAEWDANELQPLGSREYAINANWKLAAENFLDVYHLPFVHGQLGGGLAGAIASEDFELAPHIFGFRMPEGYGPDARSDDREEPKFSSLSERNRKSIEVFCIFPNTLILVEPDWQQVITLRPGSASVVHETFADYMALGAKPLEPELQAEYFAGSAEVNDQDQQLLEKMQRSRSMPAGGLTKMSEQWDQTPARFQQLWLKRVLDVL